MGFLPGWSPMLLFEASFDLNRLSNHARSCLARERSRKCPRSIRDRGGLIEPHRQMRRDGSPVLQIRYFCPAITWTRACPPFAAQGFRVVEANGPNRLERWLWGKSSPLDAPPAVQTLAPEQRGSCAVFIRLGMLTFLGEAQTLPLAAGGPVPLHTLEAWRLSLEDVRYCGNSKQERAFVQLAGLS